MPVGIISTNWGGTIAEAWTSHETLASRSRNGSDRSWNAARNFKAGNPNQPSVLYNSMIKPLVPFAIRGAIWYQGESNVGRAEQYAKLFPAMIADWRKAFWPGGLSVPVRAACAVCLQQADRARASSPNCGKPRPRRSPPRPNTGMCVTTDIATINDIHPPNKQDVGAAAGAVGPGEHLRQERPGLFRPALRLDGDRGQQDPRQVQARRWRLDAQRRQAAVALHDRRRGPEVRPRRRRRSTAKRSSSAQPDVPKPVAVRFGWTDTAEPNLFNRRGLPASPFRTDSFPMVTAGKRVEVILRASRR